MGWNTCSISESLYVFKIAEYGVKSKVDNENSVFILSFNSFAICGFNMD